MLFPANVVVAPVDPSAVATNGTSARVDALTAVKPLVEIAPTDVCKTEPDASVICCPSSVMSSSCP